MLYCSWDMVHDRCNCYFSFWAIFCPFTWPPPPPLTPRKMKIWKKWKKHQEISCVTKIMIRWCTVPEIWCVTDGRRQTTRWKKWHIEVGAPPKKPSTYILRETSLKKNDLHKKMLLTNCCIQQIKWIVGGMKIKSMYVCVCVCVCVLGF